MAFVSQEVDNLLNGVSQQPPQVRSDSQAAVQENAFADPARGLRKRPPTTHKMLLDVNGSAYEGAMVHPIHRDENERYHVIVTDGALKVFDVTANEAAVVTAPDGFGYLGTATPAEDIRAVTVGDTTFLTNRRTKTAALTKTSPALRNEALVVIRAVDFSTLYSIGLNTPGTTVPTGSGTIEFVNGVFGGVEVLTPVGDQPEQRSELRTDTIAAQLIQEIKDDPNLGPEFVVGQYGSAIHIRRANGGPFNVMVSDGLGNEGMLLIQHTVNNADDLPPQAPPGYVVHVLGSPAIPTDDFYLKYEPGVSGVGAWQETVAPGATLALDPSTMPHVLVRREKPLVEEPVTSTGGLLPALLPTFPRVFDGEWFAPGPTHPPLDASQNLDLWEAQHDADGYAGGRLEHPGGGRGRMVMAFDVDTTGMPTGASIEVRFDIIGSGAIGSPQYRVTRSYVPGIVRQNETLEIRTDDLTLVDPTVWPTIVYHSVPGGTDTGYNGLVMLRGIGSPAGPGLFTERYDGTRIVFDPAGVYPADGTFTFTINGTVIPLSRILPGSLSPQDLSSQEVVRQLVAGMPSTIQLLNVGTYEFTVHTLDNPPLVGGNPDVSISLVGSGLSGLFTDVTMIPGEFIGELLTNESTGATGTVTSNSAVRITVGALTGGSRQTILPGDILSVTAAAKFTFGPYQWAERRVGDDTTNPFPSIVGKAVNEVFIFSGRVGFVADTHVLLSAADDPSNLFRHTATEVLDSDPIDVTRASQRPGAFHSALSWDGDMYLFTDSEQYKVNGNPLTPSSIALPLAGRYPTSSRLRPMQLGQRLWSTRVVNGFCEVLEYSKNAFNEQLTANARTQHVPVYLAGNPVQIIGDDTLGFLAVLTDGGNGLAGDTGLYVYQYVEDADGVKQAAWSRWTFPGANVVGVDMLDSALALVVRRADGLYLETIDLADDPSTIAEYADRQGQGSRPTYPFTYTLSPLYLRSQGKVVRGGRLQLRYLTLAYTDSQSFTVTVTPLGPHVSWGTLVQLPDTSWAVDTDPNAVAAGALVSDGSGGFVIDDQANTGLATIVDGRLVFAEDGAATPSSTAFSSATPASGTMEVPILENNEEVTIAIHDASPLPCAFTGFYWEGWYDQRTRRV